MELILEMQGENWIACQGGTRRLNKAIQVGITPASYRKFDQDRDCWLVHWTKLKWLVDYARQIQCQVDYQTLPTQWQMVAAGAVPLDDIAKESSFLETENVTFKTLHITETAPIEVVKAAYKALAGLHHPDHGGDRETFQKVNAAYQAILKIRGHIESD